MNAVTQISAGKIGSLFGGDFRQPAANLAHDTQTIIIGCGGGGIAIARRYKFLAARDGLTGRTQFLAFDTDSTSQRHEGIFPGFSEEEFCHLDMSKVDAVLARPENHAFLSERYGLLDDPELLHGLREIRAQGGDQAGQVPMLGSLAFQANYDLVLAKIEQALQQQFGQFSELEGEEAVARAPRIFICSTVLGGTGRSFFLDLGMLIRSMLPGTNSEINACLVLPNAFDGLFRSRNEKVRVQANGYSGLRTVEALANGFALGKIRIGRSQVESISIPELTFNRVILLERFSAGNRDVQKPEAVYDKAALHLYLDTKTALGPELDPFDVNYFARQEVDPITEKPRRYSTVNATEVSIDAAALTRYATGLEFVHLENLVAAPYDRQQVKDIANAFVGKHELLTDGRLAKALRAGLATDVNHLTSGLVARGSIERGDATHHSAKELKRRLSISKQKFERNFNPAIEKQLVELGNSRLAATRGLLHQQVCELVERQGLRAGRRFATELQSHLKSLKALYEAASQKGNAKAAEYRNKAQANANRLWAFSGKQAKIDTISTWASCLDLLIDANAAAAAADIMQDLLAYASRLSERLADSITALGKIRQEAEQIVVANTPSGKLVGQLHCELDLSSQQLSQLFWEQNRADWNEILRNTAEQMGISVAELKMRFALEPEVFQRLGEAIFQRYLDAAGKFNIADILENILKSNSDKSREVTRRIIAAIDNCQPSWRAKTGRVDLVFADHALIGVPANLSDYPNLQRVIQSGMARLRGRTNVSVRTIQTSDPHRIVALRRTHGACLHYLNCWSEMKLAYESWQTEGGHPVDAFSRRIVAAMPAIEPEQVATASEEMFALALAFAWISRLGNRYFWNLLHTGDNGSTTWQVQLASDWDGLAFRNSQPQLAGPLAAFQDSQRIQYRSQRDADSRNELADRLDDAMLEFASDRRKVDWVKQSFEDLRQVAGEHQVATALSGYADRLLQQYQKGDALYEAANRQAQVISQVEARIRGGA